MKITDRRILVLVAGLTAVGCGTRPDQRTVMLTPQSVGSKVAVHYEVDDEFYCSFKTTGNGPRIAPEDPLAPGSPMVVGWEFFVDYGTEPFPCGTALRHDYAAALLFDLSEVVRDGGVVERAILRFRRGATTQPINVPEFAAPACTLYALAPSSDWDPGYYVGSEADPEANLPATLLYGGTPRTIVHFRNSADPADVAQELDVTTFISSTIIRRALRYHGLLLSSRWDPTSRAIYLAGGISGRRPPSSSCTGLFSDFQLEISLVRLDRGTP